MNRKFVYVGLVLVGVLLGSLATYALTPSDTFYISSGVYPGAPTYTVFKDGSTYFAKNAQGQNVYSGTNKTEIIEDAVNAIGSSNGTIVLKNDVVFNPSDLTFGNNIIIEYEDGTNVYEEYYYKILVALTSPSLQHLKYSNGFSLVPNQTIYSSFYTFIRYAGMDYNYADLRTPGNLLTDGLNIFNETDTITAQGPTSVFFYVTQDSVDLIENAKAMWFKRLYWLQITIPSRIMLEEVEMGASGHTNFTIGTYGSIITNWIGQGFQFNVRFVAGTIGSQKSFQCVSQIASRSGEIAVEDEWQYSNGLAYFPMKATYGVSNVTTIVTWQITENMFGYGSSTPTNPNFAFKAYAIANKYDLPSWWESF